MNFHSLCFALVAATPFTQQVRALSREVEGVTNDMHAETTAAAETVKQY